MYCKCCGGPLACDQAEYYRLDCTRYETAEQGRQADEEAAPSGSPSSKPDGRTIARQTTGRHLDWRPANSPTGREGIGAFPPAFNPTKGQPMFDPSDSIHFYSRAQALAGVATSASYLLLFRALELGDVARVTPLDWLSLVFAIMLGSF
jgi:hypothetical protein